MPEDDAGRCWLFARLHHHLLALPLLNCTARPGRLWWLREEVGAHINNKETSAPPGLMFPCRASWARGEQFSACTEPGCQIYLQSKETFDGQFCSWGGMCETGRSVLITLPREH